ncbi:MAG: hypothetical protein ACXVIU_12715 [Halobacteriota archaeon]
MCICIKLAESYVTAGGSPNTWHDFTYLRIRALIWVNNVKTWLQLVTLCIGACLGGLLGVAVGTLIYLYVAGSSTTLTAIYTGIPLGVILGLLAAYIFIRSRRSILGR